MCDGHVSFPKRTRGLILLINKFQSTNLVFPVGIRDTYPENPLFTPRDGRGLHILIEQNLGSSFKF